VEWGWAASRLRRDWRSPRAGGIGVDKGRGEGGECGVRRCGGAEVIGGESGGLSVMQ